MNCTLFAIASHELEPASDASLPGYDDASASRTLRPDGSGTLALGAAWPALHAALGGHGADHPLGFLDAGGELRPEFAGASSSGRYFDDASTVAILAALARIPRAAPGIEQLRIFVAEVVATGRGIVVHRFR